MNGLRPFTRRPLPPFPGYPKALGPGIVWLALAQGSGDLIWWPYIVAPSPPPVHHPARSRPPRPRLRPRPRLLWTCDLARRYVDINAHYAT